VGCWPIARASEIPHDYLQAFMLRGTGEREGILKAGAALREVLRFERLNLTGEPWPRLGAFDLVFLRNVLIYFDAETRRRVLNRVAAHVAPGGHLLLGHAETLGSDVPGLRSVSPSVYRREGAGAQAAGAAGVVR
jgi:chemotaxis protein methyltransferase CheR